MSKTKNPLFSFEAHGTIADLLTYQKGQGGSQLHRKNIPRNPDTEGQKQARENFRQCVEIWQSLSTEEKEKYNQMKIPGVILPGFNLFISLNFGKVQYWAKFGETKFGAKKFGGP